MLEGLEWALGREAYSVIFARGLDKAELLRRLGGDLSSARLARSTNWDGPEELRQQFDHVIQAGWCDGWAFAYEWNGPLPKPEAMRALSIGTTAVAVYRNVNAVTWFYFAEDGTLLANFDPIHARDQWFWAQASPQVQALLEQAGITPRVAEDEEDDEDEDYFNHVEDMHALAEAAGVRLDRASIADTPLLCSGIP
ncbi:MAG TPA: DUF6461 domain-containing protein [Ktedonobacterales bacterium]|nr:DUF6461 domain-containing protein [Ktedonobacterales bacterium]